MLYQKNRKDMQQKYAVIIISFSTLLAVLTIHFSDREDWSIMRKEASLDQWRLLYEVAIKFKKLKPWNHIWDVDLTKILLLE